MVTATVHRWFFTIMLLILTLIYGCGSMGGVDGDDNIGIEIQAQDYGFESDAGTLTVDVFQACCRESGEDGENTYEPFGNTLGDVTFKYLGADGADNTYRFDNYTVEYIPLTSPDGEGGTFVPPDLQPLDRNISNTIVLSRNFTESLRTIILIPINTKSEYLNKVIRANLSVHGLYSLKVTFFGEKNISEFAIDSAVDVALGNYNHCPDDTIHNYPNEDGLCVTVAADE